jgi:hypothetical protein
MATATLGKGMMATAGKLRLLLTNTTNTGRRISVFVVQEMDEAGLLLARIPDSVRVTWLMFVNFLHFRFLGLACQELM